jgi:hypothetical protein
VIAVLSFARKRIKDKNHQGFVTTNPVFLCVLRGDIPFSLITYRSLLLTGYPPQANGTPEPP